ncbi:hypothetical protein DM01DRAFT_1174663 [Hesseltinella vesiculosa]|uniref:Uncharacterized protein n=1 Tax=Hesseltinella vesiculosa TaxID=101127 RepID=A0A1X2G576_9FUNG|nr:hypothetical protein DM01DRAFT_1174663 [Hesseltinella vesiculosa]
MLLTNLFNLTLTLHVNALAPCESFGLPYVVFLFLAAINLLHHCCTTAAAAPTRCAFQFADRWMCTNQRMMMILKKSLRLIKIAQPTFDHSKNEEIANFCQGVLNDLRKRKKKKRCLVFFFFLQYLTASLCNSERHCSLIFETTSCITLLTVNYMLSSVYCSFSAVINTLHLFKSLTGILTESLTFNYSTVPYDFFCNWMILQKKKKKRIIAAFPSLLIASLTVPRQHTHGRQSKARHSLQSCWKIHGQRHQHVHA